MTSRLFSYRTALAAAVCMLSAACLRGAEPEYLSLAGVKNTGFQKWIDDARDQGYDPVYINGYDVGDHTEYAGVAIKTKTPFEARFGMTEDDAKDFFKEMSGKGGFRPTVVSSYHTKAGPRFAAVWIKDKFTNEWKVRYNQSQKAYEDAIAAMRDDGFVPTCVSAYQGPDGGVRYTSLFYVPKEGVKWETRINLSADRLDDQVDKWQSSGFRITRVHAYDTPNGLRFLATARKADDDTSLGKERHGMSGDQYQEAFDELGEKGYRPICICGYRDGGEVRFAAIWVKSK